MRTRDLILPAIPLLFLLSGCEGGLGGDIHDRPEEFTAASLEVAPSVPVTPPSGASRSSREAPARSEEAEAPEPAPAEGAAEAPAPAPIATPKPSGGGGGRGRGRGGKGSHTGAITVVDPGAQPAGSAGVIRGTVRFEGEPPLRLPQTKIAETEGCHAHEEVPLSEELVVEGGRIQNVFVYLKSIPAGVDVPPAPSEPFVLDQVGCRYVPHVAGLQAGQPLHVSTGDDATHNVRCSGARYIGDNRSMAGGSPPLVLPVPASEEIPIRFVCDIHPWMSAKVCVVEHPWFDVSAQDGTFTISDVPPGTYKIEAWQEMLGKAKVGGDLVVGPGGQVQVDFTYKP